MPAHLDGSWSRIIRGMCYVLVIILVVGCSSQVTAPEPEDSPSPGTRGSGVTNNVGIARLELKGSRLEVSVVNADGAPVEGVQVGATVGKNHIAIVAADPSGTLPPGFAIYPRAPQVSGAGVASGESPSAAAALVVPLVVKLAVTIAGGALSFWELYYDPLHQTLVVDDGLLKTCIAGDIKDLAAAIGPLAGLGSQLVVLSGLSKGSTLAFWTDVGSIGLSQALTKFDFADTDRVLERTCTILVGDATFSALLVVVSGVVGGGILAQDDRMPSGLYVVDPASNGQDVEISRVRDLHGGSLYLTDMAQWDSVRIQNDGAALSHPVVYAVSYNTLYRLDRRTGVARPLASLGNRGINALAFDRSGRLFASGGSGELLQLDSRTGLIQRVVRLTPQVMSSGDLVFLPDGRLLATVYSSSGSDILAEINTQTGAVTTLGAIGYVGVYGLAYFAGEVWGLTVNRELLQIDSGTGRGTLVRRLGFGANGGSVGPP